MCIVVSSVLNELPRLGGLVNLCGLVLFASCTWTITSSVWREPHAVTTFKLVEYLISILVSETHVPTLTTLKFKLKMVAVMGGAK